MPYLLLIISLAFTCGENGCSLLRKVEFLLKSDFQVIAFFILSEVGYLVLVYKFGALGHFASWGIFGIARI